jgi:hypothetical protein
MEDHVGLLWRDDHGCGTVLLFSGAADSAEIRINEARLVAPRLIKRGPSVLFSPCSATWIFLFLAWACRLPVAGAFDEIVKLAKLFYAYGRFVTGQILVYGARVTVPILVAVGNHDSIIG